MHFTFKGWHIWHKNGERLKSINWIDRQTKRVYLLFTLCPRNVLLYRIISTEFSTESLNMKELDMKRLSERRDLICLIFAMNSLRLENFKTLFPMHKNNHEMKTRQHERYHVKRSYGKRYAVSAIPSMQKLLNKEHKKQREAFKSILSPTNYAL